MSKYTITTSIFYTNAQAHMGHVLEWTQADFLARYHRMKGSEVYFQVGLDEHGIKMARSADRAGMAPQAFIDEQHQSFAGLAESIQLSPDRFIRTSEAEHKAMAQALWKACEARGDIYKKTYRAWYDIKQEEFLGSVDEFPDPSVFGVEERFIEKIEEENYFFAASKYTEQVVELLKSGAYKVYPENRMREMLQFVAEKGLQDVSISRDKSKFSWGIDVPGDADSIMYVWFDALTNYLTGCATIEDGKIVVNQAWPVDLHCVGKDIARFHALLWPAMLLSAGLALPKGLLVHGMLLKDGRIMSKSIGNVIQPDEAINAYGIDALRWYLLKAMPTMEDGDFSLERLKEVYSSDLANDYGNLVSRVVTMNRKYCGGLVPDITPEQVTNLEHVITRERWAAYDAEVEKVQIQKALQEAHQLTVFCNRRIEELKPWEIAKDEHRADELKECLYELLEVIRNITAMIWPAMPQIAQRVACEVFTCLPESFWQDGAALRTWGSLQPGKALGEGSLILFPRHD